jgi:tetratricopeptide (TPR) repeat protein
MEGVKGTTVSFNTLNAPKKAKEAFEKAGKELHKEKINYSKVKEHLEKAKDIYPDFAAAWQLLGQVNPHVIRAHYFHAVAHYYMQHDAEAEEAIRKVQESDEGTQYPASHYLLGGIFAAREEYETAATEYRRFLQTRPHMNLVNEVEKRMSDWEGKGLIQPAEIEQQATCEKCGLGFCLSCNRL